MRGGEGGVGGGGGGYALLAVAEGEVGFGGCARVFGNAVQRLHVFSAARSLRRFSFSFSDSLSDFSCVGTGEDGGFSSFSSSALAG